MAYTNKLYGQVYLGAFGKLINDLASAGTTIKCALLLNTYTFDQDTHVSYADISSYEVSASGTNYSTGGVALTTKSLTYSNKVTTLTADNPSWANATLTARYAVFYDDTTAGATNKKLICCVDFGEDKSASASTFEIKLSASGICTFSVS